MPLSPERRAEIRRKVQEPFLKHGKWNDTLSSITASDYDPDDFEPDERSVDKNDPAVSEDAGSRPRPRNHPGHYNSRLATKCVAVWCVGLKRKFDSMKAAAEFVKRKSQNIRQAIDNQGQCGRYFWEIYDEKKHGANGNNC